MTFGIIILVLLGALFSIIGTVCFMTDWFRGYYHVVSDRDVDANRFGFSVTEVVDE